MGLGRRRRSSCLPRLWNRGWNIVAGFQPSPQVLGGGGRSQCSWASPKQEAGSSSGLLGAGGLGCRLPGTGSREHSYSLYFTLLHRLEDVPSPLCRDFLVLQNVTHCQLPQWDTGPPPWFHMSQPCTWRRMWQNKRGAHGRGCRPNTRQLGLNQGSQQHDLGQNTRLTKLPFPRL